MSLDKTFKKPLVSVIIPVYNGANFLSFAINSVLEQTYENIELLIVNDGSNDDGKTEAIALSAKSDRFKIKYFFKQNGGVASSLNKGIEECNGEYICWLSHDDVFPKDKISKQIDYLLKIKNKNDNKTILYSKAIAIDENGKKSGFVKQSLYKVTKKTFNKPSDYFDLRHIFYGSMLIPSSFLKANPFVDALKYSQDTFSYFQMLTNDYQLVFCPKAFTLYRIHKNQGSFTRLNDYNLDCDTIYKIFCKYYDESKDYLFLKKYLFSLAKKSNAFDADNNNYLKLLDHYSDLFDKKTIKKAQRIKKRFAILYKVKKGLFGR